MIESGRRSGKCCDIDNTYVYTEEGLCRLREFAGNSQEGDVVPVNQWVSSGTRNYSFATSFYNNGFKTVSRLKTKLGYELSCVPEHRVKVINQRGELEWRYSQNLQIGDYVALSKGPDIWNKQYYPLPQIDQPTEGKNSRYNPRKIPDYLTEDYAYLLGLAVGDGDWKSSNIRITGSKEDLLEYWSLLEETLEGATINIQEPSNRAPNLKVGNASFKKLFAFIGYTCQDRDNKAIPDCILKSPRSVVASFLRGLFDTDGFISKDAKNINLSTACWDIAKEVQLLLLNFGIVTSTRIKTIKGKNYYTVSLIGLYNRRRFAEEIGFGLKRKSSRLSALYKASKEGGDYLKVPYQKEWCLALRDSLPVSRGELIGKGYSGFKGRKKPERAYKTELRSILGNLVKEGNLEELSYGKLVELLRWLEETGFSEKLPEIYHHFKEFEDYNYFFDRVQSFEEYETETGDLAVPQDRTYTANGIISHNTTLVGILGAYEFYKLCKLDSPQEFYSIGKSTPISILAIATNYDQSVEATFGTISGVIKSCRYLKRLEGNDEIKIGQESIRHPGKMISIRPGNSKTSSQVGGTLKALILDEVARFQDKSGRSNAEEIRTNIGASLATFGDSALLVAISSAWQQSDAIQNLYERSKDTNTMVGFRFRTKDLNPEMTDDNPIIKAALETDPEQAYLEYYGIRPVAQNAYLKPRDVERAFRGNNQISVEPYTEELPTGDQLSCLSVKDIAEPDIPSGNVVHLDPALKSDFYGFAIGHAEFEDDNLFVVIDSIFAWEGTKQANTSISNVYDVLMEIHQTRPIEFVSSDGWNAAETVQKLKSQGIQAQDEQFNNPLQLKMYRSLKNLLMEGRIVLPRYTNWSALLERELKQVELINNGKKIDHPNSPGASKDIADCVAAIAYYLSERTVTDYAKRNSNNVFGASQVNRYNFRGKTQALQQAPRRRNHFKQELKKFGYSGR
ncbi:MAG: LAGLIDADG family homing endonuclease [Halobacteria archaeon]